MNRSKVLHIQCRDLFKIYKRADIEVVALRGLDLEVREGDLIAIVGASGSGKTTLLNILSGLDRPSAGEVQVRNKDLLNISHYDLEIYRRLDVGFVWQVPHRNLVPYLTALENVSLPMTIAGVGQVERDRRATELLSALGLADVAHTQSHDLSGGEQQRIAIAVAMSNNPPLLLADEPTGELDTQTASSIFGLLRRINEEIGTTVIIVTHDAAVINHVSRVVNIRDGRISSERLVESTFQRQGETEKKDYLVVDRAGRLQIPQEYIDGLQFGNRARIEIQGNGITISPEERTDL